MKTFLFVLVIALVGLAACSSNSTSPVVLEVGTEIHVPEGYTFVGASAYGHYGPTVTHYCQQNETGIIVECTNGTIGRTIVIPDGYFFIGASAYGHYGATVTYYCGRKDTDRVFICLVE